MTAVPSTGHVRLVATDLDGTLVHSDGTITERTRAALRAVEDTGVVVVFVTGRPLRWARHVFDDVGGHGLAIVANGALVWDVAADRVHTARPMQVPTLLEVCRRVREAAPGASFAVESLSGMDVETGFMERYPLPETSRRGAAEDVFDREALKVLARHEELEPQEFWDAAREAVGDLATVTWSSESSLLEISAAGVTKATTLELLCDDLGLTAQEVMAFGDMPNDLPMLAWAGTAYAMENAHPTVLEVADHVAPHHDEDGVATVLERLLADRGL